jgi:hypothetical protein
MSSKKSSSNTVEKAINNILDEVSSLRKEQKELHQEVSLLKKCNEKLLHEQNQSKEMMHLALQLINDLSAKKDIELAMKNIPSVAKGVTSTTSEKKINIMTFFKRKYEEDASVLYDIVSEEQIKKFLQENAEELKNKKGSSISTLLYKKFITGNKSNKNLLRLKKEKEEEEEALKQKELIGYDLQEETSDDETVIQVKYEDETVIQVKYEEEKEYNIENETGVEYEEEEDED